MMGIKIAEVLDGSLNLVGEIDIQLNKSVLNKVIQTESRGYRVL